MPVKRRFTTVNSSLNRPGFIQSNCHSSPSACGLQPAMAQRRMVFVESRNPINCLCTCPCRKRRRSNSRARHLESLPDLGSSGPFFSVPTFRDKSPRPYDDRIRLSPCLTRESWMTDLRRLDPQITSLAPPTPLISPHRSVQAKCISSALYVISPMPYATFQQYNLLPLSTSITIDRAAHRNMWSTVCPANHCRL